MGAFPGTVQPLSAISGDLMAHLRYPEDLFKVQRNMLAKYHVTDPAAFYGGQDFWTVPPDPTETDGSHPAAVLPDPEDARGRTQAELLADVDVHPGRLGDAVGADGLPGG